MLSVSTWVLIPLYGSESQQFTKTTQSRVRHSVSVGCQDSFYHYIRFCKKCNYTEPVSPQEWDRYTHRSAEECLYVLWWVWLTYLCEPEGRPWHHVNTEQCHYKLSLSNCKTFSPIRCHDSDRFYKQSDEKSKTLLKGKFWFLEG